MDDNVISFRPGIVGDGVKIDPNQILKANMAEGFIRLVLVGERPDGELVVAGSDSGAESLMLLQWGSQFLVSNRVVRGF